MTSKILRNLRKRGIFPIADAALLELWDNEEDEIWNEYLTDSDKEKLS